MCDPSIYHHEIQYHQNILYLPSKHRGFVPEVGSELYVKRVPTDVNCYDLLRFFSDAGEVFQVRVMIDHNNQNRGYAYVQYTNKESAKDALTFLKNRLFHGTKLFIEKSFNNRRIFLNGLPFYKTKEEIFRLLFNKFSRNVTSVQVYPSYDGNNANRGFAFIEFRTHEDAAKFRSKFMVRPLIMWRREISVDWSIPTPEWEPEEIETVTTLLVKNLNIHQTIDHLEWALFQYTHGDRVKKFYRAKDYAFVYFFSRHEAERVYDALVEFYQDTIVEVMWADPLCPTIQKMSRRRKQMNAVKEDAHFSEEPSVTSMIQFEDPSLRMDSIDYMLLSNMNVDIHEFIGDIL